MRPPIRKGFGIGENERIIPRKGFLDQFRLRQRMGYRRSPLFTKNVIFGSRGTRWHKIVDERGKLISGPIGNTVFSDNWIERWKEGKKRKAKRMSCKSRLGAFFLEG